MSYSEEGAELGLGVPRSEKLRSARHISYIHLSLRPLTMFSDLLTSARFAAAIARIDAVNAADPHTDVADGQAYPKELLYARRMTVCLDRFEPTASELLHLAARAQHIMRWTIPRDQYPQTREGYLEWRKTLMKFHAQTAGEIMAAVGYGETQIARVQALIQKQSLKRDPESQLLEDVVGLVFLEYYAADFARQHPVPKVVGILQQTFKKMSARGRDAALRLALEPSTRALVETALQGGTES